MQVQLPLFFFCLLIHAGIFQTSNKFDRKSRLLGGVAVQMMTWLLWYCGTLLEPETNIALFWLGRILVNAPYYFPFVSFLVYIRRLNAK